MQSVQRAKPVVAKVARAPAASTPAARAHELLFTIAQGKQPLSALFAKDPMTRVEVIREGLPVMIIDSLSMAMKRPKEHVYGVLGIPRQTAIRKAKEKTPLDLGASERAMCIAGLIGRIEGMTKGSAPADFDAGEWVAQWLESTHPALGGVTPSSFLDTADGRQIVMNLIGQIEAGSYA